MSLSLVTKLSGAGRLATRAARPALSARSFKPLTRNLASRILAAQGFSKRFFATAAVAAPTAALAESVPFPTEDPMIVQPKRELQAGNTAEAYGLHPDAGLLGKSGIFEKYGYLSILGWAGVAAISKEWIILDEEVFLLATFLFASSTGYVFLRQPIKDSLEQSIDQERTELSASYDSQIDAYKKASEDVSQFLGVPSAMQEMRDNDLKLESDVVDAANKLFDYEVKVRAEKVLRVAEADENKFFSDLRTRIATEAPEKARAAFVSGPNAAKLRAQAFADAVSALKTKKRGQADPVKPMILEFVQNQETKVREEIAQKFGTKL